MVKVGIIGFGFIGRMHLATLRAGGLAEVVAVADGDASRLARSGAGDGNIAIEGDTSLVDVETFEDPNKLLDSENVEAVILGVPTYLHKSYILKSIEAGKHILCEKPMVLDANEGCEVIAALEGYDRVFMVAHCIRFWPAYVKAYELVREQIYGHVLSAHFVRNSPKPLWAWDNWLLDEQRSGGAILDLHIHDVDYVNYLLGKPTEIAAAGIREGKEGIGQIVALYTYADGPVVSLDGGWAHQPTFPFRMTFRISLEEATLESDGAALHVHTASGEHLVPELLPGDGYSREQEYFFACIRDGKTPAIVTVQSSLEAIALVEEEKAAIGRSG
ncbi:MAG TPA: Gfo/Idh/MocA family oxidoreductase [Candidatus Hydrogenedentes bacterium]|nr:Gfo/Idh/MocA family oxidoreductase [Candidatus Hydrogenedentota bacterium]HIJ74831.1 Gfo/Idh/MocA family oxidoreductase [Candidatus Hydrogenedentota bacterium]